MTVNNTGISAKESTTTANNARKVYSRANLKHTKLDEDKTPNANIARDIADNSSDSNSSGESSVPNKILSETNEHDQGNSDDDDDDDDDDILRSTTPPVESVTDDTPLTPRSRVQKLLLGFKDDDEDDSDDSDAELDLSQIRKDFSTREGTTKYYESAKLAFKYREKGSSASSTATNNGNLAAKLKAASEGTSDLASSALLDSRQSHSSSFLMGGKLHNGASDVDSDSEAQIVIPILPACKPIIAFEQDPKETELKSAEERPTREADISDNYKTRLVTPFSIQDDQDMENNDDNSQLEKLQHSQSPNSIDRESDAGNADADADADDEDEVVFRKPRVRNAITPPPLLESDSEEATASEPTSIVTPSEPLTREQRIRNLAEKKRRERELENKNKDDEEEEYENDDSMSDDGRYQSDAEMGKSVSSQPTTQRSKKTSKKELEESERTMQKIHRSLQLAPKVETKAAMTVNDFISKFNKKGKRSVKEESSLNNIAKVLPKPAAMPEPPKLIEQQELDFLPQKVHDSNFTDTVIVDQTQVNAESPQLLMPAFDILSEDEGNSGNHTGNESDSSMVPQIEIMPTTPLKNLIRDSSDIVIQRTPNGRSPSAIKSTTMGSNDQIEKKLKKMNLLMTPRRVSSYLEARRLVKSPNGRSDKSDLDLGSYSESDSDLEVVPTTELDQKPAVFRKLEMLSGKRIHQDQPARNGVSSSLNNPGDKANKKKTLKDLKLELSEKLRQQVIAERKEKIDAIKARGGYVEDKENFDSTDKIVESLLEHEMRKNEELKRKEMGKSVKKREFFDDEEDDDEDWMDDVEGKLKEISDSEFIEKEAEAEDEVMDSDYGNEDDDQSDAVNSDMNDSESENDEDDNSDENSASEAELEVPSSQTPANFNENNQEDDEEINYFKRVKAKRARKVFSDDEGEEDMVIKATQSADDDDKSLHSGESTGLSQFFLATDPQTATKTKEDSDEESEDALRNHNRQVFGYNKNKSLLSQQMAGGADDNNNPNSSLNSFSNHGNEGRFQRRASHQISDTQSAFLKPHNLFMPTQLSQFSDPSQDDNVIMNELSTQADDENNDNENYKTAISNFIDRFDDEQTQVDSDEVSNGKKNFLLRKKLSVIEETKTDMITATKKKVTSKKESQFNKKTSAARGIVDEEAFESEDEYAGIGGASDDNSEDEVDSEVERMMNDENDEKVNKTDVLQKHAEFELQKDQDDISKLLDDVNGGFRRKRTNIGLFDLSSDDEDITTYGSKRERARKREKLLKRRKENMLNANDKLSALASNPKANAFVDAIADVDGDNALSKYLVHLQPEDEEEEEEEEESEEEGEMAVIDKNDKEVNEPETGFNVELQETQRIDRVSPDDESFMPITSISRMTTQSISFTSTTQTKKTIKTKTIGLKRQTISKEKLTRHVRSQLSEIFAEDHELGNDNEEDDEQINDGGYYKARRYDENESTQLLNSRESTVFEDAVNENSDSDLNDLDNNDDLAFTSNADPLLRHLALRRDRKRNLKHIDSLASLSQDRSMASTQLIEDDNMLSVMPSMLPIKRVTSSFRMTSMTSMNGALLDETAKKEIVMSISNKAPTSKNSIMTKGIRNLGKTGGGSNSMNKRTGIVGLKRNKVTKSSSAKPDGTNTLRGNRSGLLKSINQSGMFS